MTTQWINPPADNMVVPPLIHGLFHSADGEIEAWSGFDPDAQVLCYSYRQARDHEDNVVHEWWINTNFYNAHNT